MEQRIYLEAIDPAKNCFRFYSIEVGRDLFGTWLVDVTYGRIGTRGRTVSYGADNEAAAMGIVNAKLRQRASAQERIGVAYLKT